LPFVSVRLSSFRNLEDAELDCGAERVFLVGENGQGKTNFLEALYYLSYGSSFRGPVDAEVPRRGEEGFSLEGRVRREEESSDLPPEVYSLAWSRGGKEIRRGGKRLADRKELVESNPAVVFCHEDFSFSNGEPERRRFFFDQTAGLISTGYIDVLRAYKRALKQRNAALRENRISILEFLDEEVARQGLLLMAERKALAAEFEGRFTRLYEAVSRLGEEVGLRYRPSWPADAELGAVMERLASKRAEELALGTSLSGPHRDRWSFVSGGRDFAATASTGQLRLLSLVLRTAQADYYSSRTGRRPILLLDDVLLELDPGKRRRFFESLPPAAQAFFTFLPGEPWEDYRGGSTIVYHVEHGRLAR
jgi:DNA replication and repair protein RecF